jgi:hypothetical protein
LNNHSLRVALVYRGTVYQERAFTQTSDPVITVGEAEDDDFVTPDGELAPNFEMFERGDNGYTVRFTDKISGTISLDDEEYSLEELAGGKATKVSDGYEIELTKGDWALFKLGDLEIFSQVLGKPAVVAGRGLRGLDMPVVGTTAIAAVAHFVFLLICFLSYNVNPSLKERHIPDRFVKFMVDDVEDPLKEEKKKEPQEDTTGKKAGGEEGKFGKEDAKMEESKVPKNDGPMKKKIDVKNMGVNKMLASKNLGGGPLKNIFGNQDGFDSKMNVAMSGSGSELQVGRGAGGMGLRGTGSGGGGEGFGRVHGLGKVDTGGGQGTGAKIGTKKKKKVKPKMSRGTPKIGDFCDKGNIRRVVSAKSNSIQYCYERQLQTSPGLKGKIIAQWKIGLQGQVKSASIASSTMGNAKVESCITRVIKRMRFEKPDGGICIINYPFVFTGGGG